MNLAAIALGMIDRPGQAMREATARRRSWWLPAVLLVLSMLVLAWYSAPYQVELANERTEEMIVRITANMSEEQARAVREQGSRQMTVPSYMLTAVGTGLALAALGWVARGTIVHYSSMALGGNSTWGPTFAAGVWSMLPFFVRDLLLTVYVAISGQVIEHAGLSFLVATGDLVKDSQNPVYSLLGNTDPFALWHIVLLAAAVVAATRLSRTKAVVLSVVVWAVFLGLKVLPVVLSGALLGRFTG